VRIISKFRDYYDSALCYGADPNLLYIRTQEELQRDTYIKDEKKQLPGNMDEILLPVFNMLHNMPSEISIYSKRFKRDFQIPIISKIIGFCGVFYPAMTIEDTTYYDTKGIVSSLPSESLEYIYTKREQIEEALSEKQKYSFCYSRTKLTYEYWKKVTEEITTNRYDSVFLGLGVPVFKVEHYYKARMIQITLNPCLKNEDFPKIKIPTDCFQEISMYLGNQLASQKDPNIGISDKDMIAEKGFDDWSFRKHKMDNKGRKRK